MADGESQKRRLDVSAFLVTGANGFIGREMCSELLQAGHEVHGAIRRSVALQDGVEPVCVGEIDAETDWTAALAGVDVIIHLAAHVHVMKENTQSHKYFQRVNVDGTVQLARSAVVAGVRRMVFLSSIGVNGTHTIGDHKFAESDTPSPQGEYANSKWKAEQALMQIAADSGLEVVIIRSPLIYGLNAPGNFAYLIRVLGSNIPLPFGAVSNLRDFIYVKNLTSALLCCATHPRAAGQLYLVCDGEPISTPDLLRQIGRAMNRPVRLFSILPTYLRRLGKMAGKTQQVDRLLNSLQVDSGKIRNGLDWHSPYTLRSGLRESVSLLDEKRNERN
jgi:nucleoside-diphosphate-sugar epimerase